MSSYLFHSYSRKYNIARSYLPEDPYFPNPNPRNGEWLWGESEAEPEVINPPCIARVSVNRFDYIEPVPRWAIVIEGWMSIATATTTMWRPTRVLWPQPRGTDWQSPPGEDPADREHRGLKQVDYNPSSETARYYRPYCLTYPRVGKRLLFRRPTLYLGPYHHSGRGKRVTG